jgi:hypothetical protein
MSSVQGANLLFAVNTNWDVFLDPQTSTYYLLDGAFWLSATDYRGPWRPVTQLPGAFNDLPNDKNFAEVKQHLPGIRIQEKDLPAIFVSTQPAVIILTKGKPTFSLIRGTQLMAVSNTDSDLFKDSRDGQYYYLISGRWFRSSSLNGPWTFATPDLPQDFARIPSKSKYGRVLYAVPGTPQAASITPVPASPVPPHGIPIPTGPGVGASSAAPGVPSRPAADRAPRAVSPAFAPPAAPRVLGSREPTGRREALSEAQEVTSRPERTVTCIDITTVVGRSGTRVRGTRPNRARSRRTCRRSPGAKVEKAARDPVRRVS